MAQSCVSAIFFSAALLFLSFDTFSADGLSVHWSMSSHLLVPVFQKFFTFFVWIFHEPPVLGELGKNSIKISANLRRFLED